MPFRAIDRRSRPSSASSRQQKELARSPQPRRRVQAVRRPRPADAARRILALHGLARGDGRRRAAGARPGPSGDRGRASSVAGRTQEARSRAAGAAQRALHRQSFSDGSARRAPPSAAETASALARRRSDGRARRGDEPRRLRHRGLGRRRDRRADRDRPHRERRGRAIRFIRGSRSSLGAGARAVVRRDVSRAPAGRAAARLDGADARPQARGSKHASSSTTPRSCISKARSSRLDAEAELNAFALVAGGALYAPAAVREIARSKRPRLRSADWRCSTARGARTRPFRSSIRRRAERAASSIARSSTTRRSATFQGKVDRRKAARRRPTAR